MMQTAVMFSSQRDDWHTPPELFAALDAEFHFDIDVAACAGNSLRPMFYDAASDALTRDWLDAGILLDKGSPTVAYCNPPYSRGLQHKFIAKAAAERLNGVTTVMLIPARTDTRAFHRYIWDAEQHQPREGVEVRFLPGRIKFVGAKHGAPFPSMVVVFRGQQPG